MRVFKCFVQFTSPLGLREVAALISTHLFGGVSFVETREFDEVPGVRLERDILGFAPRVYGETPEFGLRLRTTLPVCEPSEFSKLEFLDISGYMEQLLSSIEGIQVIPT